VRRLLNREASLGRRPVKRPCGGGGQQRPGEGGPGCGAVRVGRDQIVPRTGHMTGMGCPLVRHGW